MKIYVASSWRNERQPEIVKALQAEGHEVYDFKNPEPYTGFAWSEIDENWQDWTNEDYFKALEHPRAVEGFNSDFNAMRWADVCVLVMPCGRSAHIEAGWMKGAGKPTVILIEEKAEPELMYKLCDLVTNSLENVISFLSNVTLNNINIDAIIVENGICAKTCTSYPNCYCHNSMGVRYVDYATGSTLNCNENG